MKTKTKLSPEKGKGTPTLLIVAFTATFACSCTGPGPLRGGRATTANNRSAILQTIAQGQNSKDPSSQAQETIRVRTYTLPSGSRIESLSSANSPSIQSNATPFSVTLAAPVAVTEREELRAKTELGAAQKDSAREFTAKLSSLRPIVWLGVGFLVFGLATIAWPPLRAIIGSATTSAAIILGGLALIVLPTLIVGNELLILGAVVLTTGAWFIAHRHGHLRGLLGETASSTPDKANSQNHVQPSPAPAKPKTKHLPAAMSYLHPQNTSANHGCPLPPRRTRTRLGPPKSHTTLSDHSSGCPALAAFPLKNQNQNVANPNSYDLRNNHYRRSHHRHNRRRLHPHQKTHAR